MYAAVLAVREERARRGDDDDDDDDGMLEEEQSLSTKVSRPAGRPPVHPVPKRVLKISVIAVLYRRKGPFFHVSGGAFFPPSQADGQTGKHP